MLPYPTMEIREGYPCFRAYPRHYPVYIVQPPSGTTRPPDAKLLLGEHMESTTLVLGRLDSENRCGLHIKSDRPAGISVEDMPENLGTPWDRIGRIRENLREMIFARDGRFRCRVKLPQGRNREIEIEHLSVETPTLVIEHEGLHEIFPSLCGTSVDHYFGPVGLIQDTFDELLTKARDRLSEQCYLFRP